MIPIHGLEFKKLESGTVLAQCLVKKESLYVIVYCMILYFLVIYIIPWGVKLGPESV
jgi:hypothetical protein